MSIFKSKSLKILLFIVSVYLISRLMIYSISYMGMNLFSDHHTPPIYKTEYGMQRMELPVALNSSKLPTFTDFVKFDSLHYLKIADQGYDRYQMSEEHPMANWPFFPLYPLLMKLISIFLPVEGMAGLEASGYILSNLFTIFALFLLFLIARELTGDESVSQKAVLYLLLFPSSIFLSLIYTESLFLFLSLLSIYLMLKGKYGLSIFIASLSTITRIPGVINLAIIAFYLLKNANFKPTKISLKYYVYFLLSTIPLLSFFTYMYYLTGDFFAVFKELSLHWGRVTSFPFTVILHYLKNPTFISFHGWDFSFAGFIFTLFMLVIYAIYGIKYKKNPSFLLYGLLFVIIPLMSSPILFTSVIRYYLVSFPLFIFLAEMGNKNKAFDYFLTIFLFSFQVIYAIGYINNYYFVV